MIKQLLKHLLSKLGSEFNSELSLELRRLTKSVNKLTATDLISKYDRQEKERWYQIFKPFLNDAHLFRDRDARSIREFLFNQALLNDKINNGLFLEFGVYSGTSTNHFARLAKPHGRMIYGFDSFQGLEEDWIRNHPAGRFNRNGLPPEVEQNVELVIGSVQDTLEQFLDQNGKKSIAFIHMDLDTYSPSRFVLEACKPFLPPGAIILFDELIAYHGWEAHEFRALNETFEPDEYRFLAFNRGPQVGIEIQ